LSLIFRPPNQNPVNISPFPHACHMSLPPRPTWFNHPNTIRWRIQTVKFDGPVCNLLEIVSIYKCICYFCVISFLCLTMADFYCFRSRELEFHGSTKFRYGKNNWNIFIWKRWKVT
jgi:hypothetical protein